MTKTVDKTKAEFYDQYEDPINQLRNLLMRINDVKQRLLQSKEKQSNLDFSLIEEITINELVTEDKIFEEEMTNPHKVLVNTLERLDTLIEPCESCGRKTLLNDLESGLCLDCQANGDRSVDINSIGLVKRLSDLEDQLQDVRYKLQNLELSTSRSATSTYQPPIPQKNDMLPPPPPPSLEKSSNSSFLERTDINFSDMSMDELVSLSADFLATLPVFKRNQYTARIKELQELERMTPEEKKAYFERKEKEREQASALEELKSSLINLESTTNSVLAKMREQADKTIIEGTGVLGKINPRKINTYCGNCGIMNEIIQGEKASCKNCKATLNTG